MQLFADHPSYKFQHFEKLSTRQSLKDTAGYLVISAKQFQIIGLVYGKNRCWPNLILLSTVDHKFSTVAANLAKLPSQHNWEANKTSNQRWKRVLVEMTPAVPA